MAAVSGEAISLRATPPQRAAADEVLGTRQETDGAVLLLAGAGEQQPEQPLQENEQQQQIEQQQQQIQEQQPISQQQQVEQQHRQSQEEHQQIQEQLDFQAQQQIKQQQLMVVVEQQQLLEELQQPVHEQQGGVSVAPAVANAQLRGENWTVANIKTHSAGSGDGPAATAERELAAASVELEGSLGGEETAVAAVGGMREEAPIDVDGRGEETGETAAGERHENELLRTDGAQLYVVMPSMAQTIEKMLAAADVQYKDERVVHALVDLLQREALTVLADAAELVDLRKALTDSKTESPDEVALRQQQQGGGAAAFSTVQDAVLPGVRFRIEEVDTRAAMQEYIEKYVAQPDVLLDRVRLCSLSNSRAVGEGSTDTVLQQLYAPTGSMDACRSRASFHFAGPQHKYQEDRGNDMHGGRGGSTFFLGDGFAEAGKSMKQIYYGGKSASAGAFGGVGGVGSSGNKNPLGRAPNGVPPYLPEDVNVYTGMPQWTVKPLNGG